MSFISWFGVLLTFPCLTREVTVISLGSPYPFRKHISLFHLPSTVLPQLRNPEIHKAFSIASTSSQRQSGWGRPASSTVPRTIFVLHIFVFGCQFESKSFVFSVTFSHTGATRLAWVFDGFWQKPGGSEEWKAFGVVAQWGPEPRLCISYSFLPSALGPSQCQERKRRTSVSKAQTSSQGASLFQGALD